MRIAEVIGKVTLSKWHPALQGSTWIMAVPLAKSGIQGEESGRQEPIVVYDEFAANTGSLIGVSEGAEASAPFHPAVKPIDAYNAAILDTVEVA